jgi:Zn-dependent protease
MGDLTLQHVILRIAAVVLIASVHGGAVATMAAVMGDPGPRDDGRLGLSPLRHLDMIGGLLTVLFTFGWIRPVAVDPDKLRSGRIGLVALVAVASCATIALAVVLRLVRPLILNMLPDTAAATFFVFIETVGQLCVSFALLNLLPIPPLTGQNFLFAAMPRQRETMRRAQPYCVVFLALLIATGVPQRLLAPVERAVERVVLGD